MADMDISNAKIPLPKETKVKDPSTQDKKADAPKLAAVDAAEEKHDIPGAGHISIEV